MIFASITLYPKARWSPVMRRTQIKIQKRVSSSTIRLYKAEICLSCLSCTYMKGRLQFNLNVVIMCCPWGSCAYSWRNFILSLLGCFCPTIRHGSARSTHSMHRSEYSAANSWTGAHNVSTKSGSYFWWAVSLHFTWLNPSSLKNISKQKVLSYWKLIKHLEIRNL